MPSISSFVRLDNTNTTLIFDCQGRMPSLLYYGALLSDKTTPVMLGTLSTRQEAKCAPVIEPPISLVPTHGEGVTGAPGLQIHGNADQWSAGFELTAIEKNGLSIVFTASDKTRKLTLVTNVALDSNTSVVTYKRHFE